VWFADYAGNGSAMFDLGDTSDQEGKLSDAVDAP